MKSKLVILSLLLAGATAATAQTKETFYSESFKDNIFVSVGVGAQGCVNPDNFDYGFGKAITPLINVSVGKLFNPVWGIRGQVAGAWTTLYSNYGQPADTYIKSKNKHYFTMRADGMFNLSNAIGGYNPDRLFTVSVFAGPGLTFAKAYGDQDKVNALINGSVGLAGQFNINKYLDINIEARGEVSPSPFGNISSAHTDGAVSLTAGVTYTFGGKRFGMVNIQLAAKILKANPDKKYKVAGYADKATGSAKWNQKLSEARAQAVYDALIKEGVSKDQLELVGFGGTANMFGKNFLNRVVILE